MTHEFEDGGWWHEIVLGEVPVVAVNPENQDSLRVDLMRHHSSAACVALVGKGQCMELNLAGVRDAVRLLTLAERLLTAEAEGGGDGALTAFDSKKPDISDLVAEVVVRTQFPERALAEFGRPSLVVREAVSKVVAAGGFCAINVTSRPDAAGCSTYARSWRH